MQAAPLRERRWALLSRAQYQDGRQAEALATLRRAREVLADELGLDPSQELVGLEQMVLQQDPSLSVAAAGLAAAACPWPGLACYDVDDADTFFGRDVELADCLDRLPRTGFLAVVGPSGSGKSSLARAGIAARLRRQGRPVKILTPDPRPLDALAAATAGRSHGLVLVVDQCEEIFAPAVPTSVRQDFLAAVVERARHGEVVVTLRADRLGEVTAYPHLARLVEEGLYLLKAMEVDGLRHAIEQPAKQAGLRLEQGLVDLLVRDVEWEPGRLPLLAHALSQTWERREGTTLTVEGYRASGGIDGAVAQSAEKVYEDGTASQRTALRELLLRMVQLGPTGEPTRTSVARDAVGSAPEHAELLERLVRARLVTAEEDRLELAHESLTRAWPRLQAWLVDDVEGERIRHHLAGGAQAWDAMGRPGSELYRGARLAAAREWRDTGAHPLSEVEKEFLAASEAAHLSRLARAEDEARRKTRLVRRLRLAVVGASILAVVATSFGVVARAQWRRSQDSQTLAAGAAERVRSHELAASALATLDENPSLAASLAVLAADTAAFSTRSTDALHRVHAADHVVSRLSISHFASRLESVISPDGSTVAMTGENAFAPALALEVRDTLTGALVWELARPDEAGYESALLAGAAYSPDGTLLAGGALWNPGHWLTIGPDPQDALPPAEGLLGIHLWDTDTHEQVGLLDVGPCGGWPLKLGDQHVLARGLVPDPETPPEDQERVLRECLWDEGLIGNYAVDLETGESTLLGTTDGTNAWHIASALSGDGSVGAVPDPATGETVLVDVGTGEEVRRLPFAVPHDLDPTGELVLVRDVGQPNVFWKVVSVTDGSTVAAYHGHPAGSIYGTFGHDGSTVLTTGTDGVLVRWEARTGRELQRIAVTGPGRPSAARDDQTVAVPRSSTFGTVVVDTEPQGEGWSVPPCGPAGFGAADQLRVAGENVVVGRDCDVPPAGRVEVLGPGGTVSRSWDDANWWQSLDVSPDGRMVVTQAGRLDDDLGPVLGALTVRELDTGRVALPLAGFCEHQIFQVGDCAVLPETPSALDVWRARWSPDGRLIAGVDTDKGMIVWDADTGAVETVLFAPGTPTHDRWGLPFEVLFTPGSEQLLVASGDGHLVALDTSTWEPVADHGLVIPAPSAAPVGFAADGSVVVVAPYRQSEGIVSLALLDPGSLVERDVWPSLLEGSARAAAVSPDGTRIALASSEGFVGVWDLSSGALVDRVYPELGRIQGVQWLDEHDLVLLAAQGEVLTVTTDPARLLSVVRGSLTRGLTSTDCASYGIDPCPDLATLRGSEPTVPEELRGGYDLAWSAEDLAAAAVAYYEDVLGSELDAPSVAELTGASDLMAGDYRLTFGEASYEITRAVDGVETVLCAGSVTASVDAPGRLLLGAEAGDWCLDFHYAEIGWERDGDTLVLPRADFRGSYLDALVWTLKPLRAAG